MKATILKNKPCQSFRQVAAYCSLTVVQKTFLHYFQSAFSSNMPKIRLLGIFNGMFILVHIVQHHLYRGKTGMPLNCNTPSTKKFEKCECLTDWSQIRKQVIPSYFMLVYFHEKLYCRYVNIKCLVKCERLSVPGDWCC